MQVRIEEAEVVWPPSAKKNNTFILAVKPNSSRVIIFRKERKLENIVHHISTEFIPRRLKASEMQTLIRAQKEINSGFARGK